VFLTRAVPLLLMNLRSFLKAALYAILSCALLVTIFTIAGIVVMGWLSGSASLK